MSKLWLRAIALNELFGAALIASVWVWAVVKSLPLTPIYILTSCLAFFCSALAGALLLRSQHLGRQLSIALQFLQIAGITASGVSFRLELGAKFTIELSAVQFMTHSGFNGLVAVGPTPGAPWSITVNVLALAAFVYLVIYRQASEPQSPLGAVAA